MVPYVRVALSLTIIAVSLCFTGAACSTGGASLVGDIYIRLDSGEVRRGADILVVLVPMTTDFTAKWQKLESDFKTEDDDAVAQCQRRPGWSGLICNERRIAYDKYSRSAIEIIRASQGISTRADINGHYGLRDIQPGQYFVFAALAFMESSVRRRVLSWKVPVLIKAGKATLDLAASNAQVVLDLNALNEK